MHPCPHPSFTPLSTHWPFSDPDVGQAYSHLRNAAHAASLSSNFFLSAVCAPFGIWDLSRSVPSSERPSLPNQTKISLSRLTPLYQSVLASAWDFSVSEIGLYLSAVIVGLTPTGIKASWEQGPNLPIYCCILGLHRNACHCTGIQLCAEWRNE